MDDTPKKRKAYHIGELPDEWFEAIINAKMDSRHDHLNTLLEPDAGRNRKVGLAGELSEEMLEAALNAKSPVEAEAFNHEVKEE